MKIASLELMISVRLITFDCWEDYSVILPVILGIKDYVK